MNYLLPIETISREIDFKIHLACILAQDADNFWIGQHDLIHKLIPCFPDSIYVGKNIWSTGTDHDTLIKYKQLKANNVSIVYLHEEGAVFSGNSSNWEFTINRQYDPRIFESNDVICTWGKTQQQINVNRGSNAKIFATGHPRLDLYKEKYRPYFENNIKKLKSKYGEYILFSSNHSLANHGLGSSYIGKLIEEEADSLKKLQLLKHYSFDSQLLSSFIALACQLSLTLPHLTVVYRPHPSENTELYSNLFRQFPNIEVSDEGPIYSWILASHAVVHNGCTSAIEAYLSGKSAICYAPFQDKEYDIWLPNILSHITSSIDEVVHLVGSELPLDLKPIPSVAYELLENLKSDSYSLLCEQILSIKASKIDSKVKNLYINLGLDQVKRYIKMLIPVNTKTRAYHLRKFNGFKKQEILDKIRMCSLLYNKAFSVDFINPFIFRVSLKAK